jgi:hypothetical protein
LGFAREMAFDGKSFFEWRCYLLPFFFMSALGVLGDILDFLNINELIFYLIAGPVLEEIFKFWTSKKYSFMAVKMIIFFSFLELFLVKIPIIWSSVSNEFLTLFYLSLPAVNFHIATAFIYTNRLLKTQMNGILVLMVVAHSFFNYIPELNLEYADIFILQLALSFLLYSPIIYKRLQILFAG